MTSSTPNAPGGPLDRLSAGTPTPLYQQAIILLFALLTALLVAWYAVHGTTIPDWLAGLAGVYVGFVSHALGVSQGK